MKRLLLIGINEKVYATARIIREIKSRKINYTFIKWGDIFFKGQAVSASRKKIDFSVFDAAFIDIPDYTIVQKSGKRICIRLPNELRLILQQLKERGIPSINTSFMLDYPYYNKFTQSYLFSKFDIPFIDTLHFTDNKYEKINKELCKYNYPIIAKESTGGMGKEVWKLNTPLELKKFLKRMRNKNLVFQKYIPNDGDYRVMVCGGKVLGIMKRIAQEGEWKNNFSLGGKVKQYKDTGMENFALETCKKLGLEYAGLDIFKIDNGYVVIEINIFASFKGFESTHPEINISKEIIDFLKTKVST